MTIKRDYIICVEIKEYETGNVVSKEFGFLTTSLDEFIMGHFMHERVEELAKELEV